MLKERDLKHQLYKNLDKNGNKIYYKIKIHQSYDYYVISIEIEDEDGYSIAYLDASFHSDYKDVIITMILSYEKRIGYGHAMLDILFKTIKEIEDADETGKYRFERVELDYGLNSLQMKSNDFLDFFVAYDNPFGQYSLNNELSYQTNEKIHAVFNVHRD